MRDIKSWLAGHKKGNPAKNLYAVIRGNLEVKSGDEVIAIRSRHPAVLLLPGWRSSGFIATIVVTVA
jgi:hypothetical protein